MAQYTALIAAWNSSVQPPSGVVGTALSSAMSTAQKITTINGWTITGAVPTSFTTSGSALANCINWPEFSALTAQQQSNLLALCNNPGPLLGGSTNASKLAPGMFLSCFPFASSGPTIQAVTALAQAVVQPWWQVTSSSNGGGLGSPVSNNDAFLAGLS